LKSVLYIVLFLILQAFTVVYSQDRVEIISKYIPADTAGIKSNVDEKQKLNIPNLNKSMDSTDLVFQDTTAIDSVRIRFLPGMGQIINDIDSLSILHQKQFLWSDAKVIGDLIWKLPGFFFRDLGEAGKWGQLNAFGMDGRTVGIILDGRPMNDPVTGTYNLSDLPLELIDHTEILVGSASIAALSGTAGTALNFISRSYNSYHPTTKIRFVQDPKGTLLTDGLFTQNVARGLNLMIGFSRQVSDGRFSNSKMDAWNVRTRLRYNISDRLNISLTDFYTKAGNGLNGGVDRSYSSDLDEAGAKIISYNAWDKRSRRDVSLNTIARLFPDSSSTTQANIYYTTSEREYYYPSVKLIDDFTRSSFWGVHLRQQINLDLIRCTVGGSWEERKSDSTRVLASHFESERSLFIQAEMRLTEVIVPTFSLRSISFDGKSSLSTGAGIKSVITDWLTLSADISWFDRFPTLLERYWNDSTFLRSSEIRKEQHTFLRGGFTFRAGSNLEINLEGFKRNVDNAIVSWPAATTGGSQALSISNVQKVTVQGINGSAIFRFNKFEVIGVLTLTNYKEVDTIKTLIPDLILAGELSYRNTFFNDKLDVKLGVRSRFCERQQSMQFDPQTLSYAQYNTALLGRSTTLDMFMILKIGDAHISVSWNNILDATYMFSPIYPMPGRNIRVGVNWVFLD
jgi:outer membrane cobalamin receptor